jgi:hypothetical protein
VLPKLYKIFDFSKIYVSLFTSGAIFYLIDSRISIENRKAEIVVIFIALFTIIHTLTNLRFVNLATIRNNEKVHLWIVMTLQFIPIVYLLRNSVLINSLDFWPQVGYLTGVTEYKQPLFSSYRQNMYPSETEIIYNREPLGKFYPLATHYVLAFFKLTLDLQYSTSIITFFYLTVGILYPLTIFRYITLYIYNYKVRIFVFIITMSLTIFPYSLLEWGHLPTLASILFALNYFIILRNSDPSNFPKVKYTIPIAFSILSMIHPVGIMVLIYSFVLDGLYKINDPKNLFKSLVTFLTQSRKINIIIVGFLAVNLLAIFFQEIRNSITENLPESLNSLLYNYIQQLETYKITFDFYNSLSITERILNFISKNMTSLHYGEHHLFFTIINVFVFIMLIQKRMIKIKQILVLVFISCVMVSTAFSQQDFPFRLLALPTLLSYSSPGRNSILLIMGSIIILALHKQWKINGFKIYLAYLFLLASLFSLYDLNSLINKV